MKYFSEFLWTHSWDVSKLDTNKSEFLTLISNISVHPGFNLLHLNTIVSLVGHLLRPLVLLNKNMVYAIKAQSKLELRLSKIQLSTCTRTALGWESMN